MLVFWSNLASDDGLLIFYLHRAMIVEIELIKR